MSGSKRSRPASQGIRPSTAPRPFVRAKAAGACHLLTPSTSRPGRSRPDGQGTQRRSNPMRWITRERVKVDRVACPWLIKKFVDKDAEFIFVPGDKVMAEAKRLDAIPYDVPNVELGHHGKECSFEA